LAAWRHGGLLLPTRLSQQPARPRRVPQLLNRGSLLASARQIRDACLVDARQARRALAGVRRETSAHPAAA
jgi:hypothetical protein